MAIPGMDLRINLSFQIPKPHILQFAEFEDFHFVLAHLVLEDKSYLEKVMQLEGFKLMDNGVHETGEPLSLKHLIAAAAMCDASAVIPPDRFFDMQYTVYQFLEAATVMGWWRGDSPIEIWPVVQGRNALEFETCYRVYYRMAGVGVVCIPYRARREGIVDMTKLGSPMQHHFLGLDTPDELEDIRGVHGRKSLDTGKPFRYAQNGLRWADVKGGMSIPKLDMEKSCRLDVLTDNLEALRDMADGRAT